ncbi:MAG TPA: asparagine synthase (glutamine-hydrolyzing) [Thermoanaerobaculaceae bacterium]|nr:asparagine synthase (glutamine-hydrolyzing) [Candidatus Nitrosotalea sp.]HVN32534.1 asparagine synthase (glutamine-hydrolyzing) [Thermoanaerobaculaceae bacterium]
MCGIGGILMKHGRADQSLLERMAGALTHRGPDDLGMHVAGPLGLLQTRLSVIDLEHGHQPMVDGHLALTANGEIYNFVELRRRFEARGRHFATGSDSETILHAYALDGFDGLRSLNGMFAFGLYDSHRRELLLARDRLGVKPLYYARLDDRLLFASELKALLAVWPLERELDPGALVQYLQNRFNTGEASLVRGIRRLPPGTALVVDSALKIREHRYWSSLDVRPRRLAFDQAAEEFEPLFRRVMLEHLRADVPYGLFLSSGVDSGVLLAMITELTGRPVHTFSVGYSDAAIGDELPEAATIARRFGANHTEIRLDRDAIFRRLPHTVWSTDDLLHDYACLPTSYLAEQAARTLKVVLTGEGGDEVFAGYGRYRRTLPQRWIKNLVAPGSGGYRTRGQWRAPWVRHLLGPELRAAGPARRAPLIAAWRTTPADWSDVTRCQHADLVTWLPDELLVKTDRVLMSFGLEGRVPFLDHRVVEFGLSLPDPLKVGGRQGKLFLKQWAERRLPRAHLWRRKRGFYVPMRGWLHGEFLDRLAVHLPGHPAIRRWFRPAAVEQLLREQQAGADASRAIWGLTQLAIWHRIFIEGHVPGRDEDPVEWIA